MGGVWPTPAALIFNAADLEGGVSAAFHYRGHFKLPSRRCCISSLLSSSSPERRSLPVFHSSNYFSPVVRNCLIRVLVIIVIKESSVHFRKKEGKKKKKACFSSTCVLWFIRTDWPRKTGENRGVEPPNGDAIANAVSPSDCVICTNNNNFS